MIVLLITGLGFIQEYRAQKAIAKLRQLAVPTVRVRRSDHEQELSARQLVPGDIIFLEGGELVPADCRLLENWGLRTAEAALTGVAEPVDKDTEALPGKDLGIDKRCNMVCSGTVVTYGRARAIVTETGMNTQSGRIASLMEKVEPEPTPLQKRLARLGGQLAIASLALEDLERELIFIGLVGIDDPMRPEARAAILGCHRAGIRPVLVTGDRAKTAGHVARELALAREHFILTDKELDRLTETELTNAVSEVSVYARVSPEQKLRIVRALQKQGQIVAMTGDGINDAPALKAADNSSLGRDRPISQLCFKYLSFLGRRVGEVVNSSETQKILRLSLEVFTEP